VEPACHEALASRRLQVEVAGPQRRGLDRYVFTLYAVDRMLALPRGASPSRVIAALIGGHVRASATLVGVYSR